MKNLSPSPSALTKSANLDEPTSTRVFGDEFERDLVNTPDLLDTFDRLDLPEWFEPTDAIDIIEEAERREASSTSPPMGTILMTVLDAARLGAQLWPWEEGADLTERSPLLWLC